MRHHQSVVPVTTDNHYVKVNWQCQLCCWHLQLKIAKDKKEWKKKFAHVPGVDTGYFRHRYTDFGHTNLGTFLNTDVYFFFSVLNPVYSFNSSDLCQVLNIKEEAVFFLCLSRIALVSLGQYFDADQYFTIIIPSTMLL